MEDNTHTLHDHSNDDTLRLDFTDYKIGDVVWYTLNAKHTIKRSKIVEVTNNYGAHIFILCGDFVMENGDTVNPSNVFRTKQEALDYLIKDVTANINWKKIHLATIQHEIEKLERTLRVLQKRAKRWETEG